jgi:hypothetical protein
MTRKASAGIIFYEENSVVTGPNYSKTSSGEQPPQHNLTATRGCVSSSDPYSLPALTFGRLERTPWRRYNRTKKDLHAAQIVRDLRVLYSMQPDVLAADRDLFRDSLEDHLTDNIHTIQQWVLSHRQIIHHSQREARRQSIHHRQLLPTYFHPLKSGRRK